jgi:SAM-dependent methyltransferase
VHRDKTDGSHPAVRLALVVEVSASGGREGAAHDGLMRADAWGPGGPVWRALAAELARLGDVVDVLDAGGGTGGLAVPLAALGHRVSVVDPSPDALAALQRRAAEAGVAGRISARQADAGSLPDVVGADRFDLVCVHQVLEVVDDPEATLRAVVSVLRAGGAASVLVATRAGAALHRAVAGRFAEAASILADPDGRGGQGDPLARRFDDAGLTRLVRHVGLLPEAAQGIRAVTDLVPATLAEGAADELAVIEERAATLPAFRDVAGLLHLLARRPDSPPSEREDVR